MSPADPDRTREGVVAVGKFTGSGRGGLEVSVPAPREREDESRPGHVAGLACLDRVLLRSRRELRGKYGLNLLGRVGGGQQDLRVFIQPVQRANQEGQTLVRRQIPREIREPLAVGPAPSDRKPTGEAQGAYRGGSPRGPVDQPTGVKGLRGPPSLWSPPQRHAVELTGFACFAEVIENARSKKRIWAVINRRREDRLPRRVSQ